MAGFCEKFIEVIDLLKRVLFKSNRFLLLRFKNKTARQKNNFTKKSWT
jgi:hypothetical protein